MADLLRRRSLVLILVAVVALGACAEDEEPTGPGSDDQVTLVSVSPTGGSTDADPGAPVMIQFDHPMVHGMEAYCALHEGDLNGPEVSGSWEWSEDHRQLAFMPDQPLERGHQYALHIGGGMVDTHGHGLDFHTHGLMLGGAWVHSGMLGHDGMMGGTMGAHPHMADVWRHPNGMYGMMFPFETAP